MSKTPLGACDLIVAKIRRDMRGERGFALVVTLSLMILLSILALGMLSLSSIALRTSSGSDSQLLARANARMALMMAIGQLQREMGPDSRISAPHDVGNPSDGMPRWTAVYDAWKTDPANSSAALTPQSRVPKFRSWLVSGANGATGDMIPMVGNGSLGTGAAPEDLVSAPLVDLSAPGKKGKIAWWISDESVKAKVNAGPESPNNAAFGSADAFFNAQSPPNLGHKAFTELSGLDWKAGQRGATVSTGVLSLAAGLGASGVGSAIHDLTVHSAGVLADVREGRLKRDLSSLLARPISELENKPLYLADGRMNRFQITEDGAISNASNIPPTNGSGADRWGINLEELHLFHQLHREVDWSTGKPSLVNKNTTDNLSNDRFYIYKQPVIEALSITLSFLAIPDTAPDTYKIQGMLDAMVGVSNPNDIPIIWPSNLILRMEMHSFPYLVDWNILRKNGTAKITHKTGTMNAPFFKCFIKNGFTILPGEAAVFGSSLADTQARVSNLTRGFVPRGGVAIGNGDWGSGANVGLRAVGLVADDIMDFAMIKATGSNLGAVGSGWIMCPKYVRNAVPAGTDLALGVPFKLGGGGGSLLNPNTVMDKYMLTPIKPPQKLAISNFIGKPLPVMMITMTPNVEKSRTPLLPPNAIASRPFQLREPAITRGDINTQNPEQGMQTSQWLITAEPMDYEPANDRTLAAGVGGKNLYQGGAREVGLGGSFNVIKRRIPLVAPLSIGSFENAIACGLVNHFATGSALDGTGSFLPATTKSIGNSWSNPFLPSDLVQNGTYHDPSWMVNNALWDSWFLSGIVDGRGAGSSTAMTDSRTPRGQFKEFAEGTGSLRNKRFKYLSNRPLGEALDELFNGEDFKPAAVSKLPKYLLVDGAFNVNSTSEEAWKAFLTSVRDQELMDANGALQKKSNPFGTLGYAVNAATSGTEGDWSGFRDLTDTEMGGLAKAIVTEVKARGPFLNMADFVNRRPDSTDAGRRALGALQAAIDKTGLNDRYKGGARGLVPADLAVLAGKDTPAAEPTAARAIGSAGFLSQAALLTAFGAQVTVRGDTFVIRAYGDFRNASNDIISKAWCEAVVQRMPEYVDETDAPDTTGTLTAANSQFGRQFGIIHFRWLKPEEI